MILTVNYKGCYKVQGGGVYKVQGGGVYKVQRGGEKTTIT